MKFPTFTGQNPNSWLRMVHEFFEYYGIPVWDRFPIVAYHVKGEAAIWFRDLERFAMLWSWESFVRHLKCQFRKEIQEEEAADQELANRIAEMRAQREESFRQMKAKFQEIQEFPILKRLEFPRFIGEDPEEWRCRAEEFFACYRTPDEHRVPLSTLYLEGKIREMEWFRNIRFSKCAITWEKFVRTLRARIAVPAKEESLEQVKDEEEEQRDEETNLLEETNPVATTYHGKREEKKSTDDAHYTLISATEPDEDTTPIQNSDPDEVEKRDKIILRPDPIEDTTNPAKEPAEDPKHAKITAADPVDDAYHLFDEIPPRISESFLERPFPDPAVPNVIILVAINHTVSSLVPQNSYEDGVDFVVLKHRWRWK